MDNTYKINKLKAEIKYLEHLDEINKKESDGKIGFLDMYQLCIPFGFLIAVLKYMFNKK